MEEFLRLHRFLPDSRANGPGSRAVIWVQGCSLGCPGCFNPVTHAFGGGRRIPVTQLFQDILDLGNTIQGITISGGEPLQQQRPLLSLLRGIHSETTLSVLLFSGFTWQEIQQMPGADEFLNLIDVLIAGRYDQSRRLASALIGSANKSVHFLTDRYSSSDLHAVPPAEVIVTSQGEILLSGIDPLIW